MAPTLEKWKINDSSRPSKNVLSVPARAGCANGFYLTNELRIVMLCTIKCFLTTDAHYLQKYRHQYKDYYRHAWPDDGGADWLIICYGSRWNCWNEILTLISNRLWFNVLLSPIYQGDPFAFDSPLMSTELGHSQACFLPSFQSRVSGAWSLITFG